MAVTKKPAFIYVEKAALTLAKALDMHVNVNVDGFVVGEGLRGLSIEGEQTTVTRVM